MSSNLLIPGTRTLALVAAVFLGTAPLSQAQKVPITTSSDAARTAFEEGRERMTHSDFKTALTQFETALQADPNFGLALMYKAVASPDDKREAIMEKAAAVAATDGERQMIAAYAATLTDDRERAISILTALIKEYPGDAHLPFNRGFDYYQTGRYAEATASFQLATQVDPTFAGTYNMLGYAAMEDGDDPAAEKAFREYIRLSPKDPNPRDSLGEFYMVRGRSEQAE